MGDSVDVGRRMRHRMEMVSMWHVVDMSRCMRDIMEMGVLIVALCVCKLSGSENCDCGQNDCARLKH